ncbi:segmentation protein even-skipped [Caerostris darwini]|uniref:Segmentation protein even-skipped n=1 Tax=Caerostris darwini TaxID=1538125 RepID=A0AAV4WZA5_9ARAC|nr:segmentation protein even-skipped [Caerostris darwini]
MCMPSSERDALKSEAGPPALFSRRRAELHPAVPHGLHAGAAGETGEGVLPGELRVAAAEVRACLRTQSAGIHHQGKTLLVWFQNRRMKDKRQRLALTWPYTDPHFAAYIINAAYAGYPLPPPFAASYYAARYPAPPSAPAYLARPQPPATQPPLLAPAAGTYIRADGSPPFFGSCVDPCRCHLVGFTQPRAPVAPPPQSTPTPPPMGHTPPRTQQRTQLFQPYKTDLDRP